MVGVAAVIDKDLAAQKLALDINADTLLILTSVGQVALDYGTPKQRFLETMTVDEAKRYSVQRVRYDVQGTGYPDLADVMAAVE